MHGFVSNYTNKLDAKGRVSIPAPFRTVLARDGYEGLYCFPSPHAAAVDAGGNTLIETIETRLRGLVPFTPEHDMMSTALFGASENLKIDREGRVILGDAIRQITGITDTATFVGLGYKFQIWSPERFAAKRAAAMQQAFGGAAGAGGGNSVE